MGGCVMGWCVPLFSFQLQKREINYKGGYLCQVWRNVRGVLWSFVIKRDVRVRVSQKRAILAWRNYWTTPKINSFYQRNQSVAKFIFACFQKLKLTKLSQILNLKLKDTKFLVRTRKNMEVVLCFILTKIFILEN